MHVSCTKQYTNVLFWLLKKKKTKNKKVSFKSINVNLKKKKRNSYFIYTRRQYYNEAALFSKIDLKNMVESLFCIEVHNMKNIFKL